MRLIPLAFVTSAVLLMTGCGGMLFDPEPREIRLEMQVSSATLAPGDTLDVTLTMRNPSGRPVELTGSSSCPPFGFRVFNAAGEAVFNPREPQICTADYRTWPISGRGTRVETRRWTGLILRDGKVERLPAGTYRLVGYVYTPWQVGHSQTETAPILVEIVD